MRYHVLVRQVGLVLKHQCIIEVYTSLFLSSLYVKRYMYYVCQYNTSVTLYNKGDLTLFTALFVFDPKYPAHNPISDALLPLHRQSPE